MRPHPFLRPGRGLVTLVAASCLALPVLATPGDPGAPAAASAPTTVEGLGIALDAGGLDGLRGGDGVQLDLVENTARTNGEVTDNHAENIISGNNTLSGEAFSNASGINTAIQNSGSNVLIQNATVVNVQFADPSL